MEPERLQKRLAALGLASRRQAEQWIREGRVVVNGIPAELGQRVADADDVRVDGRRVRITAPTASRTRAAVRAFIGHRSPGESLAEGLVLKVPRRDGVRVLAVSPMPSIDGGLELLATDGSVAAALQRAVRRARVDFQVRVRGALDDGQLARIREGSLDDGSRANVESVEVSPEDTEGSNRWYAVVTIGASGKSIRQLFERQGAVISRVLRTALGPLTLTRDLPRGRLRAVDAVELSSLGVEATAADTAGLRPEKRDVRGRQGQRRR